MNHVLIICAGGMSSSLMAKKTTEFLRDKGYDMEVDATSTEEGRKRIEKASYDLYLVSPQTKMYYDGLKKAGDRVGKPVENIPPQAYVPIPMGVEKLGNVILESLPNGEVK
ncbi:PTS cellobiose transporter subunit IIB [Oceanobacillus locisalsi]|uniref:PTS cellobiose transporter subunit IIB n=1 Tax=Oceanobacillus locisalsi TaxID=546107 RepID=A0ABW3NLX6_9BACI